MGVYLFRAEVRLTFLERNMDSIQASFSHLIFYYYLRSLYWSLLSLLWITRSSFSNLSLTSWKSSSIDYYFILLYTYIQCKWTEK